VQYLLVAPSEAAALAMATSKSGMAGGVSWKGTAAGAAAIAHVLRPSTSSARFGFGRRGEQRATRGD